MKPVSKLLIAAASLVVLGGTARADDPPADGSDAAAAAPASNQPAAPPSGDAAPMSGAYTKDTWPTSLVARPLTLAKGMVQVHVDAIISLSKDAVFKPFAIAPDLYYGVDDKLTVGLTHGTGLCLTGTDNGCAKVYNDVGLDALFQVKRDAAMELALHGGIDFLSLDAIAAALRVGVSFKYVSGKLGIFADPALRIGLTNRDPSVVAGVATGLGNKETLTIPITVAYQANDKFAGYLKTGVGGLFGLPGPQPGAQLDGFGDNYLIPLGVGALYSMSNKLDVGAELIFPGITGSSIATGDIRLLQIFANFRL